MDPSAARVAAPSFIVSTRTRYGCSAPFRVKTCSPSGPETTIASTSPLPMARRESSASSRRNAGFHSQPGVLYGCCLRLSFRHLPRPYVQSQEDPLRLRHVADEFAQRLRQFLDQGGD